VGDGVDDRFAHHFGRHLVDHRRLSAVLPRAHGHVNLGHHEVHGLIGRFEQCALVRPIERYRLGSRGAVEVGALHLGRNKEPLWPIAEQQHRRVGRTVTAFSNLDHVVLRTVTENGKKRRVEFYGWYL